MGDNLAEELYKQYVKSLDGDPVFDRWELLSSRERYAWEQVAAKARAIHAAKQNDEIEMLRGANDAWQRECAKLQAAAPVVLTALALVADEADMNGGGTNPVPPISGRVAHGQNTMPHDESKRANRRDDTAAIELPAELDRERAIDVHQLSALTGLAVITIRQNMARGADLPRWFRIGRTVRWRLGDVLDWRDARTVGKAAP